MNGLPKQCPSCGGVGCTKPCSYGEKIREKKRIPISAAKHIAKTYGYDQVIIIARKTDTPEKLGGEHVTTYGVNKQHCKIAADIGNFIKYKIMGWKK